MGKGTIKSGGTAGLYTIDIVRDTTAMDAWLVKLQQRLIDIDYEIAAADDAVSAAKSELDAAVSAMNVLIDLWSIDQDNHDDIVEQSKVVAEKGKNHRIEKQKRDALILDKASISKQIAAIQSVDTLIETPAWCADYTEDLTGDVGTVEIPGDRTRLLIRPGDDDQGIYNEVRDGQLQPTQSSTSATVAWNYAMFPGWQKWIPQYRSATITAIDEGANTCSITFDAELSTAQPELELNVNHITTSSAVPILYMTCDQVAFGVGDVVLVEFQNVTAKGTVDNWANPKVIGFINNPKECPTAIGYRVQPNPGCERTDNEECWNGWGSPFYDEEEPPNLIDPPWGTIESGSQTQSLLIKYGDEWQHFRDPQTAVLTSTSGTIDWQGNGMLCGWYGGDQGSRYRIHHQSSFVAYKGKAIRVPNPVTGACIREFDGGKYIISVSDTDNETRVNTTKVDGTPQWQTSVTEGTYDLDGYQNTGSFWLFNESGTEAVQVREYSGVDPTHTDCHITSPVWRRKLRLTVSLRWNPAQTIVIPDIAVIDLGDEMPVFVEQAENYTFHTAARGTVGSGTFCDGGGLPVNINIQGLLENEYWERDNSLSFSYKFYDFKGDVEVSAEFWNTRVWNATHIEEPAPVTIGVGPICLDESQGDERTGTNEDSFGNVTQEFPVECSGGATLNCGVRFTGGVIGDIEYTATDSYTGTGTSRSMITGDYFENRPSFGTTRNTITVSSFTRLSLAVPYMDMRFGQLITVLEREVRSYSDNHYFDYAEPQNEYFEQVGTTTTNLKITIYSNGLIVDTEEREDDPVVIEPEVPPFHQFNPYLRLAQNIHRKCRGEWAAGVRPDYLFQGPEKDPRPMASFGDGSYCLSYVDRWIKADEDSATNEDVPPIKSVMNNFPLALNIPGTFPNAAPVTLFETSTLKTIGIAVEVNSARSILANAVAVDIALESNAALSVT